MKKATALLLSASILSGVCVPSACAEGGLDKLDDKKVFVALFEGNRENKFLKEYGFEDRRTEFSLIGTCNIQGVAYVFAKNGTAYVGISDVEGMLSMGGEDLYSLKEKLGNISRIIVFKTTENMWCNNNIEEFSEKEKEEVRNFMNDKFKINETEFINKSYVEEIKNVYTDGTKNYFKDKACVMFYLRGKNDEKAGKNGTKNENTKNENTENENTENENTENENTENENTENENTENENTENENTENENTENEEKTEESTGSQVEEKKDASVKPKEEKTKSGWDKIVWGSFFGASALAVLVTSYYVFKNEISQGCSWLKNQFICCKNKISNYFKNK